MINHSQRLVVGDKADPVWLRWFREIESRGGASSTDIAAIAAALGSPDGTVANIPPQADLDAISIVGVAPVLVVGSLSSGSVTISLPDGAASASGAAVAARISLRC